MNLFFFHILTILVVICSTELWRAEAQGVRPNGRGSFNLKPLKPGSPQFRNKKKTSCTQSFRSLDGTCTNSKNPLWGSAGTPLYSYSRNPSSNSGSYNNLPSARLISNIVCSQNDDVLNDRSLSELVVFFGQFVDHNIVATVANPNEPMHIEIPPDDPVFGNTTETLHFVRSVRGFSEEHPKTERPINSLSSAVDLAAVYGADSYRASQLRTMQDGKLKDSTGNLLPKNTDLLFNAPSNDASFFVAGDHRSNEHPVLTSLHVIFLREHNRLADELKFYFPEWNDDMLYNMSRMINWAQFQKIVFEEWYPTITGYRLSPYRSYKRGRNPSISDVFSTAAFRMGHTMVGNVVSRRDANMNPLPSLDMKSMFFAPFVVTENGIEPFIRGAVKQLAQEVDVLVHSALRNFLFTNVQGEQGFDLIALNLQRSRDHGIPPYNAVRRMFKMRPVRRFSQITSNTALQSRLQSAYGSVDLIEAWIGLMAEDHVFGSSMGPTMLRIWQTEFTRIRDGDQYFYERRNLFPKEVLDKMPVLGNLKGSDNLMRAIILRNCDISDELPQNIWTV